MSLKRIINSPRTITFRLTLWHAGIFFILSLGAFLFIYLLVRSNLYRRVDSHLLEEVGEYRFLFDKGGYSEILTELEEESAREDLTKMFFRILTPGDEIVARTDLAAWRHFDFEKIKPDERIGEKTLIRTVDPPEAGAGKVRVLSTFIASGIILQVGEKLEENEQFLAILRKVIGLTMLLAVALAAFGGAIISRRSLAGVREATETAGDIARGVLNSRVPVKGSGDEIDRLAQTFNSMLDRIHALIIGMKEINDNIAHDLRSPITRIRGLAEMTLMGKENLLEYKNTAEITVHECDRLLAMINTMLDISEMDAGVAKREIAEVDISRVVREGAELFQPEAEDKGVTLKIEAPPVAPARGDVKKLQRALANILDNALKHTPGGGAVTISVGADRDQIRISISDTGIGIPENELSRIFERFYRGDKSRSEGGSGLGLSLARAIIRAHGGDITVSSFPGRGSTFTVILPRNFPSA